MSNVEYESEIMASIHQQLASRCSFLFIQTRSLSTTCTEFGSCRETDVWCWSQTCSLDVKEVVSCSINGTSHDCLCSALPPTLLLDTEPFESSSTSSPSVSSSWITATTPWDMDQQNTSIDNSLFGSETDGLPIGAIAAIVVVSFLVALALIALSVWSVLKLKRKRKLEGKYCPAVEEQKSSANTLPPLPIPAPEGLI